MSLDRPVSLIGAARSGTTLLGELLGRHRDVCFWMEPKYIWRYGGAGSRSDLRSADEATPSIARYIRRRFDRRTRQAGRTRLVEKTPSNCLRIPFVDRVLPDGRYVNIVRDGRDVTLSAMRKWRQMFTARPLWRRTLSGQVPLRDAPFYAVDLLKDMVLRRRQGRLWGPRVPGLREVRQEQGLVEACAYQWRESVRAAQAALAELPADRQITIRYEDLAAAPEEELARILLFLELSPDDELIGLARELVNADSVGRWRQADPEIVERMRPLLAEMLRELGYEAHHEELHVEQGARTL